VKLHFACDQLFFNENFNITRIRSDLAKLEISVKLNTVMKNKISSRGILRWATACCLYAGVTSCDSSNSDYTATEMDSEMARQQETVDQFDENAEKLSAGKIENNFKHPTLGYYHANTYQFYPTPYQQEENGKWFVNGEWQEFRGPETVLASEPNEETLAKLEASLPELEKKTAEEKQPVASQSSSQNNNQNAGYNHHPSYLSSALFTYMILRGNSHRYAPQNPGVLNQAGNRWQGQMNDMKSKVSGYASANPGYNKLVQQSRSSGKSVTPGATVRGAFGGSTRGSFGA
jgi:hypothetical protein